ncbi:hypothetical protein SUZIE_126935 [Sciurus carolinensis]|uniref:Uncharacterized protein n=1 Tax=Sciurus carolinensis TaxID=30640 RepID=A0AA41MLZ2_SCICA|nr:hypothetical protein [Sciurus carolinensis]
MDFQQLPHCGEMVLQHALRAHRHQGDLAQDGFLCRPWRFLLCAVSGQQLQQQFSCVELEQGLPAFLAASTGLHLLLLQEDAP